MVAGDLGEFLAVLQLGALLSTFVDEDVTSVGTLSKLNVLRLRSMDLTISKNRYCFGTI